MATFSPGAKVGIPSVKGRSLAIGSDSPSLSNELAKEGSVWMRTRRAMVEPMLVMTKEISGGWLMSKEMITNGRL